jgi:hypothetical protein
MKRCIAMGLILAGCGAYAASAAARAAARAAAWRIRYAPARILRPVPGLPGDGDALSFDETRALAGIITAAKNRAPERRIQA